MARVRVYLLCVCVWSCMCLRVFCEGGCSVKVCVCVVVCMYGIIGACMYVVAQSR